MPADQTFSLVVVVEDAQGNPVQSFQGPVKIAQPSVLLGTTTVNAVNGEARFPGLRIDAAGTYHLQATSGSLDPATSTPITITPGTVPARLAWATQPPAHATRNVGFGAAVDVEDQYGNVETGYFGNVSIAFASNPGNATLGGSAPVAANAGVVTFTALTINAVGNGYTLVASDGGLSTLPSNPIDVTQIPAVALKVTAAPPSSVQDTQAFGLTVTALDQSGNPDPDFFGSVALAIASPAGSGALNGTTTVPASGGVATFTGLTLQALGTFTLQATTAGLTPATTGNINVTAGPASQLIVIAQPPGSVTAGNAIPFQVEAEDALGYRATGFNGILTASLSGGPSGATLLGSPNAQAGSGVASFAGLSLDKAGSGYAIQVGGTGMTGTTTSAFTVTPAAPSKVTFSAPPPTQVTAGAPINLGVAITDAYGNVETSYNGLVTVALTNQPAPGPLNGDLARNASAGQALFPGLTLDTASPGYIIQASSGGLTPATSGPITVVPAAASRLVVSVPPPTNLTAGTEFGLAITAEDAYGNVVTGFNGSVALALQGPSGAASLGGGPLTLAATRGMADFPPTLAIDTAGSGWTIRATSGGLTPATSAPITVTGLPSTHLAVLTEPPATLAPGAPFGFVVAAVDQYNNADPNFHGQIAIALAPGSSATLGGATVVATSGGEASFQGLTLAGLNAPVTILATTSGMPGASTAPIAPTTPASQGSSTTLVTMANVQVVFKKRKVIGLTLSFSGGLNPGEASSLGEYQIIVAGKKNSFTARNAKKLPLRSAVYNAASHSVALTLKRPLAVKKPTELVVQGTGPSGLQDSNGNLIDGNHDGHAGGNAVALLSGKGKKVTAHIMAVTSAMIDVLLEHGDLMAPRRKGH